MSLTIDQPETIEGGGNWVSKPGVYHCLITDVDESPAKQDGTLLDALKVSLVVLSGTNPEQKDAKFDLSLWHPKPTDESDMAKKKLTRFALSACLLAEHQPGQRSTIEPKDAVGRQIVIKLAWRQKKNEQTGQWQDTDKVDLNYSDIWHVDDEYILKNNIPLDREALAMIPAKLRRTVVKNANGSAVDLAGV